MWIVGVTVGWSGCGVVGSPVPPENVGVTPIIERQKRQREAEERERDLRTVPEAPVNVPGLRAGEGDPVQQPEDLPVPPLRIPGTKP
jgi:hypothetical protein